MKRLRYSETQVAYALRQAEAGTPVADVCRALGIVAATFYAWKKKYTDGAIAAPCRSARLRIGCALCQ
jgi:putative transposase